MRTVTPRRRHASGLSVPPALNTLHRSTLVAAQEFGMILEENYILSNGAEIPKLGFGTWMIADDQVASVATQAADAGYRHFDTAQAYGNEQGLGEGFRASTVPRSELFFTTKLAAERKDYRSASDSIDVSLKLAGFDHFDLMLIHSPQPWADFRSGENFDRGNLEAWRALEDAYNAGKIR